MIVPQYSGRTFQGVGLVWITGLLAAHLAGGAAVHYVQEWEDGNPDGWRLLDQSTGLYHDDVLTAHGGALEWSYGPGAAGLLSVEARASASGGHFSGDYFDVGSSALEFEFYSDTHTILDVELWNETAMLSYAAEQEVHPGWQIVRLPLLPGLFRPWMGSASAVVMQELMEDITRLWITARPVEGSGEQGFRLRRLVLAGSGTGYGAWIREFGGAPGDWLPASDWDGDGHSNAEEHVAGTDPDNPDDVLVLSWTADSMTLHWPSVTGREYSVWCAGEVPSAPQKSSDWLPGTGEEIVYPVAMPEGFRGCNHYHVRVRRLPP